MHRVGKGEKPIVSDLVTPYTNAPSPLVVIFFGLQVIL